MLDLGFAEAGDQSALGLQLAFLPPKWEPKM